MFRFFNVLPLMPGSCRFVCVLLSLLMACCGVRAAEPDAATALQCLLKAYPEVLVEVREDKAVISRNGEVFSYDEALADRSFESLLIRADLRAQMQTPYPAEPLTRGPAQDIDPGRIRSDRFFKALYGSTEAEVRKHIQAVYWAPCRCYLPFTQLNGAAAALRAVGDQIASDPVLMAYMTTPAGSFNWRNIAGTTRQSVHALAAAIDFRLPNNLGRYWRWDGCRTHTECPYPAALLADDVLPRIVRIFESNGFIWGGKWHHYDAMHFEFRPELTGPRCRD